MLVLTRRQNESILIGDDIVVNVVSLSGDKVRVSIEAPQSVRILRSELARIATDGGTLETGAANAR
jgi:carbon storage regulator